MRNYKDNDPKGWGGDSKRGASLGRTSIHQASPHFSSKLKLRYVRINSQGYDSLGTYWGLGRPLFWYANEDGTIDACLRATNRAAAKVQIWKKYPKARFYK